LVLDCAVVDGVPQSTVMKYFREASSEYGKRYEEKKIDQSSMVMRGISD